MSLPSPHPLGGTCGIMPPPKVSSLLLAMLSFLGCKERETAPAMPPSPVETSSTSEDLSPSDATVAAPVQPTTCRELSLCESDGACELILEEEAKKISSSLWIQLASQPLLTLPPSAPGEAPVERRCAALNNQDCASARTCRLFGNCSSYEGRCAPMNDSDCAQSVLCQHLSACYASLHGDGCVTEGERPEPVSAEDDPCLERELCKKFGRCSLHEGRCVALQDSDCERGFICERFGRCRAERYRCVR